MDDFGGMLRQARERRGLSLRQIAANTKISPAALEALERNDVSRLPGGIFTRAFVRAYASEVGLDPDTTLEAFLQRFDAEPPPSRPSSYAASGQRDVEGRQKAVAVVLVLVLAGLAGLAAMFFVGRPGPDGEEDATAARPAKAPILPGEEPGIPGEEPVPAAPETSPRPASVAGTVDGFQLEIRPSGDCWVSLTVDGRREISRIVTADEVLTFQVRTLAVIDVGDAGAFHFAVNGRPGRSLGGAGQVRSARLAPDTIAEYLR